jgi:hypothetical protein
MFRSVARERIPVSIATVAAMLLLAPPAASAANRFAEPAGDGAEPCAQTDPCDIETAINSASQGDDVTLSAGTYTPTVALGYSVGPKTNINIHGSPGARPVVNFAGNSSAAFYVEPGSTLRDVDVNATGTTATAVVAVDGGAVERVEAHASGDSSRACLVEGESRIRDSVCWFTGTASADSSALSVDARFPGFNEVDTARNVTAIATSGPGIRVRSGASINAGVTLNATNVIAHGAGGAGGEDVRTERIFTGSTPPQKVNLDHSNFVTVSELDSGDISDPGTGTNVTNAPVFDNAAAGDFHQGIHSNGTIDLGTATGQQPQERDLDGEYRAMGTAPDIGADEFGAVPPPPTITGTDPPSGSNENNPLVIGTAEPLSTVKVYESSNCSGPEAGSEVAEEFASPGIIVSVPDDSTTTLTATATNGTTTSSCSAPFTYTEVTTPQGPPPTGGLQPEPQPQPSSTVPKKKCKKTKKKKRAASAAKKKCKKKKKKG